MLLFLDLPDQTFADQIGFFREANSPHLNALDDWTRQRLPVFRLRCAANKEASVHRGDLRLASHKDEKMQWGYGQNSRQAQVIDQTDFNDPAKLGSGRDMVDRLSNLVAIFDKPKLNFRGNRAEGDDLLAGGIRIIRIMPY
jgi:hypothetical protein